MTVCGAFQFAGVNARLAGATLPSVILLEVSAIVTPAVGCELSTTAKVAAPPDSVVSRPLVGVTV